MSFKDAIKEDAKRIFMNPEEFGEPHTVNGTSMSVIIDNNEMLERETRYKLMDEGLYKKQILIYVNREDFGSLPAVGSAITVDSGRYRVVDAISESGIHSITLEANRS